MDILSNIVLSLAAFTGSRYSDCNGKIYAIATATATVTVCLVSKNLKQIDVYFSSVNVPI